jgi:hypothetical protein
LTLIFASQAWDDDFDPAEAVAESSIPPSSLQYLRSSAVGSVGSNVGPGAFPRAKAAEIGDGGVLGIESPWLGSSGGMFVRNITPDIGFGRNVTPDIGGGALFGGGGGGVLSSGRKLQEVLGALSSLRSVRTVAP